MVRQVRDDPFRRTWWMDTRNGPVMIKWFGNPDEQDAVAGALRLHYWAAQQGGALAQLVTTRDGALSVGEEDGALAVFEYVDGVVGVGDWRALGRAVGRLHALAMPEFAQRSYLCPRRSLPEAERQLSIFLATSPGSELRQAIEHAREVLRNLPSLRALPIGLIHTDIGIAHTLTRSTGEVVFLDTLDIGIGPLAMDLPAILCEQLSHLDTEGRVSHLNRAAAREFLDEYDHVRPFTAEERTLMLAVHRAYIICHAARYLDQGWRTGARELIARIRTYFQWLDYVEQMVPRDLMPLLSAPS